MYALIRYLIPRGIQVRDVQAQTLSPSIARQKIGKHYQQGIYVTSGSKRAGDIKVFFPLDRFRLDLKAFRQAGLNPHQVVALLRQIAEVSDETLRHRLYETVLGADFDAGSGFWLVGSGLIAAIKERYEARRALERAA
ncbi:MAG: hypothetical protein HY714_06270 [Candidatus Omnitrophica bacterium]|nr:hypothetical protein [Candidatus Omnitrophota bacterium]